VRILNQRRTLILFVIAAVYAFYGLAFASDGDGGGHGGPVLSILIELIVILLAAKLGGDLFERFSQPAVLGELVFGMIIGNLHMFGIDFFEPFKHNITLEVLAELGVIILLFEVGLESSVKEMMKVGLTSFMVAILGVVAPFFLGWGVGAWFLPLKDLGKVQTREAKIILGAAVIDDILGLIILAVVAGIITAVNSGSGDGISSGAVLFIILKAVLFMVGAIVIGSMVVPYYFRMAFRLRGKGVFLSFALLVCFLLSYIAGLINRRVCGRPDSRGGPFHQIP